MARMSALAWSGHGRAENCCERGLRKLAGFAVAADHQQRLDAEAVRDRALGKPPDRHLGALRRLVIVAAALGQFQVVHGEIRILGLASIALTISASASAKRPLALSSLDRFNTASTKAPALAAPAGPGRSE